MSSTCKTLLLTYPTPLPLTFSSPLLLPLQKGLIDNKPHYANDDYAVSYVDQQCSIIQITGCEDVQESIMTDYVLIQEKCEGRPMSKSTNINYLHSSTELSDWNNSTRGCGGTAVDLYSSTPNPAAYEPF